MPIDCTRRETILAGLSTLLLSGCCLPAPPDLNPDIPRQFVDAHCHVFNAHDIPVTQFLIGTAIAEEAQNVAKIWTTLATILAGAIQWWKALDDPELAEVQLVPLRAAAARDESLDLQNALEQGIHGAVTGKVNVQQQLYLLPAPGTLPALAAKVAPELLTYNTSNGPVPTELGAGSVLQLLKDYKIKDKKSEIESQLSRGPTAEFALTQVVTDTEIHDLAVAMAADGKDPTTASSLDYASILYVVSLILQRRMKNIEQLDKSLGVQGSTPPVTRLYVPALVDFDCWYPPAETPAPLAIDWQVKIMAHLAKTQSDPNRLVNGYVAFDPLRALLVEAGIKPGAPPLETVRQAIAQYGFLGVKLYPPMGFAPTGNSDDPAKYSPTVQNWIAQLKAKHPGATYRFGQELDRVLGALFDCCVAKDVPIMAHCGDSQASYPLMGAKADPAGWRTLLSSNPRYATLRLNLAHFGSIWCHDAVQEPQPNPDPASQDARCIASWTWPQAIIDLLSETDSGTPKYPNIYFDIADLSEITDTTLPAKGNLIAYLGDLSHRTGVAPGILATRLLYGTDWFFLALGGKQHVTYINQADSMLDKITPVDNAFHRNALAFLGLSKGGAGTLRLQTFYAGDAARLAALEALVA